MSGHSEAAPQRPNRLDSARAVQAECSRLVAQFVAAMRAAGVPGAETSWPRRLADRLAGRDRRWYGTHPTIFHPPNPGSRAGSSHLAIRYVLSVGVRGDWRLTANYTQPPSGEVSSQLVTSSEQDNHCGELRGQVWAGRRRQCVTIVEEILTGIAHENGVTIPRQQR